jgi:maltodextrin utilization protein YvdJ
MGRFQQAGMVFIAVFLTNLMLVPMMINKYREKKRKVRRAMARKAKRGEMMSTDEFADDFDEFFD